MVSCSSPAALFPSVVGCSLLPARQLCLLQVGEQQGSARRAGPGLEARGVLPDPLWPSGSCVHRWGETPARVFNYLWIIKATTLTNTGWTQLAALHFYSTTVLDHGLFISYQCDLLTYLLIQLTLSLLLINLYGYKSPHHVLMLFPVQVTLLWEDQTRSHPLASTRLYFLPEDTPKGRTREHGEVGQRSRTPHVYKQADNTTQHI